jgi:hypothetical protein
VTGAAPLSADRPGTRATRLFAHRRNTVAELRGTPRDCGVEVDVRTDGGQLVLHHDPFSGGTPFAQWLADYAHAGLIVNVKEDGLEDAVLALLAAHAVEDFFFPDQPFPTLVRTGRRGERRCAVRVSEYEPVAQAVAVAGLVDWAWVDCFTRFPLDAAGVDALRTAGLRVCLVSPELQGRTEPGEASDLARAAAAVGLVPDAVCTKRPEQWAGLLAETGPQPQRAAGQARGVDVPDAS